MSGRRRINILELRSVRGTGGGPEKTILHGAALADRDRFSVTVCYIRDRRDRVFGLDARAAALGVDYVEIVERHSFDRRVWTALKSLVHERSIDIIHAHEYKTDLLALLAYRKGLALALATAHGWTGHSARERYVYYPADKRVLARFPRVIAVSTDIRNELVRCGARPERVHVILNGIDPEAFRRDPSKGRAVRAELRLAPTDVVIGAVGRLERQKRFDLLLEAFARLARARPELRLVIVGDGSLRASLEAQARSLGLGERCRFSGHRLDISALHSAFDLFVQSSDYEGTPNAVLEAMAMETPIVATDAGGTRELAIDGVQAIIIPPGDAAALARAIEWALQDPAGARRLAEAARRRVETVLSFEARTRRLEAIYAELWQEARGR